jgi:hypothetical protein
MGRKATLLRGLYRDGAKRRAARQRWGTKSSAACSEEGQRAQPHRYCTPRLRSAHLHSSPNAQSLAERIAAPDPKVRVGRGLMASGRGKAKGRAKVGAPARPRGL